MRLFYPALLILALLATQSVAQVTPKTVHFMSDDGKTRLTGYLWLPRGGGQHPAVVMMHGRHGAYSSLAHGVYNATTLTKRHKMWGEFWAERGYVALHVDGFGPRGYPAGFEKGSYEDRPEELNEVAIRPLDAYGAVRYLHTRSDVVADRIGLQGWSNGASATLSSMARDTPGTQNPAPESGFRAALAFYPGCGLQDRYKKAYRTYAPILLVIGSDDEEVSPKICQQLDETGRRDGDRIEFVLYPGATHDFDDPGKKRQSVAANRKATADSMRRAEAFFARYLKQ
ncbi:MAG: dienelactone hydrolase family protein [Acidobacteriia bacterium]|nr:dienelactone hydrolase family protein [Terriglobia bacterium]